MGEKRDGIMKRRENNQSQPELHAKFQDRILGTKENPHLSSAPVLLQFFSLKQVRLFCAVHV
jgi:hypothetical protein